MPHINRIRVNNVKYNFGTQFYDDFILRFDGKNALYDLANGGGKSVLMLLLFQNLIPNCALDEKQPIEKLFRTDQGSTTIHSLIEWHLDPRFVKEGYKYMLTGFCARKAREELRETAAIEYFNYVIFYRGYNENDLVNLPLSNGKERVTYTGLKSYLKELGRKDMGLDVHIFERKGEYQRFISRYGLYESHWEILRGINKTEGHVRTYFETRYKTTRKVIEDLLIEEIIQKAFLQGENSDVDMADTLVQIKDKLTELSARKEEMGYYDRQAEILESFAGRVRILQKFYEQKEALNLNLVKAYHTANDVYHKKEKELAICQKEKEYAEKHIHEISRKLDTIRIQEDQEHLKQLEADTEKYAEALINLKDEAERKQKDLRIAESTNEYVQYLEVRSKWEALKTLLSQDYDDTEGVLEQLKRLAGSRYILNEQMRLDMDKKLEFTVNAIEEMASLQIQAEQKERQLYSEGAVFQSKLETLKCQEKELGDKLSALCKQVPILYMENIGQAWSSGKQKNQENLALYAKMEDQRAGLEMEIQQLIKENDDAQHQEEHLTKEYQTVQAFLDKYVLEKEKCDKLMQIYRVTELEALEDMIDQQLHRVILDYELKYRETEQLKKKLENLRQGSPATVSEAAETVMSYIRRYHGKNCVFGSDYLKDASDYERRILLKRIPFLPESIILESGLSEIKDDRVLLEKDLGDTIVPIISLAQVLRQEEIVVGSEVLFLSKNPDWYMDASVRQNGCEVLEKQLMEAESALLRLIDREKTIQTDKKYMMGFRWNFQKEYLKQAEQFEQIRRELDEILNKREKNNAKIQEKLSEKSTLSNALETLDEDNHKLEDELIILDQMKEIDEQLQANEVQQRQLISERKKNEQLQKEADEKVRWTKEALENLNDDKKAIQKSKDVLETQWKTSYESYYTPDFANDNEADGTAEEIDARFMALKDVYEKEHLDLEDKRQLMESYQQMMDTLLNSIRKKGISLRTLDEMFQGHRMKTIEASHITEMEKALLQLRVEIDHQEEILFHYREDKNKLFGSVEHGVRSLEEKYGAFQQIYVTNSNYAEFSLQQKQALHAAMEKQKAAEERIQYMYRELRSYEDIRRELERMIRTEKLSFTCTKETFGLDIDLRKKYAELTDMYQRMSMEIKRKQEAFIKDKEKMVERLRLLSAAELSEAVRTEIGVPESMAESVELGHQLEETIQIVRMEKERIEKTIQDMVQIKQNFEKQCLQRCLSIKAELERFPAYSRIVLDGKMIPMVTLKIPYVKEEMYASRMSEYIDAIVERTDAFESQEERVAYIRQQLLWKRLFSVIVTDMNRIRLNLYKRERVKEQSRYLKYEEAVGSTGQSQGIYIQFLIGVVNYISMVYSGGGDGSNLQKVIFIDNPFGAAKDIYIWQPIFELLQTNHVQLIVPTRGATPAITGKFDVNYTLGQKMVDKMQQTVVVDYHSNVDVMALEYEKLEFEQEVFDFI